MPDRNSVIRTGVQVETADMQDVDRQAWMNGFAPQREPRSLWADAMRRLLRNKLSMAGLFVFVGLGFLAIFGPYITPYDYLDQDLDNVAQPISTTHWMGTDQLGRDYLSRILYGARTAMMCAIIVTVIRTGIGIVIGTISAYGGGTVDLVLMWITDVVMNIPGLFLAILVNTSLKIPVANAMQDLYMKTHWEFLLNTVYVDFFLVFGALALIGWPGTARLIRGQILSIRERDYIMAAQALGLPTSRIMLNHLMPNAIGPVIVSVTFGFAGAMIAESSLSYLGVGIKPPGASWGQMISSSMKYWRVYPHLVVIPGIVLGIVTLGINFLGDGLNDALNPRSSSSVIGKGS